MKQIRVLIAGLNSLTQMGLQTLITSQSDMMFVGEAKSGDEIHQQCEALKPDLFLIDESLPELDLPVNLSQFHDQFPKVNILILTTKTYEENIQNLIGIGILGIALKDETSENLVQAIRAVSQGDQWFSKEILQTLASDNPGSIQLTDGIALTIRELDVLKLIAHGCSNKEIAQRLCISIPSVRFHLRNIYEKKGSHSRSELVAWAIHQHAISD